MDALKTGLRALKTHHLDNLKWHLEKNSRILCGDLAPLFVDGQGGGCISILAQLKTVPESEDKWLIRQAMKLIDKMEQATMEDHECDLAFLEALSLAGEEQVKRAIMAVAA